MFFYPVLLSPVVVALIWKWILQREGVLNAVLSGAGASPVGWLSDASWAFFWCVFVSIWAHMGFYTLILLAGLQAIPADLYEAAAMDSASPWRRFSRITLPLLMPNLIVVLVLGLIRAVQVFDEVFVLTGGGPGSATTFIVQFIYQTGFAESIHQYGLAAAASLVLALSLLVLTLLGVGGATGGAAMLNNYLERDWDAKMARTRGRALPAGLIEPLRALMVGVSLVLVGVLLLVCAANLLTGFLVLLAAFLYVLVYTPLKRRSHLSTVIGALPGAVPPLMGYAASYGALTAEAWTPVAVRNASAPTTG